MTESEIVHVDAFNLSSLERGKVHFLRLLLSHDGLGRPICVPVIVAHGRRPGPVVGLTAAVHGNELNGLPVIHRVMDRMDVRSLRGTVVGVVVMNVPGLLLRQRRFADGVDLNHVFPGKPDGTPAQVYVHAFVQKLLPALDSLIDLHTASFGRVNSLYVRANMDSPMARRMAMLQRPDIIVHNPPADPTLRGTAAALVIPAITVEIGNPHRYHTDYIRRTVAGIRAVLADQGLIRPRRKPHELPEPVICARSHWLRTDGGGLLEVVPKVAEPVELGQELARLRDEFGRLRKVFIAEEEGVVIGRSVDPVAPTGTRFIHLGIRAAPGRFRAPEEA